MDKGKDFSGSEYIGVTLKAVDIIIIFLSGLTVYYFRFGEWMPAGKYPLYLVIVAFFTLNIFTWLSAYRAWRGQSLYKEISYVTFGWILVILGVSTLTFLTKTGEDYSRLWVGWTYAYGYFSLISYRFLLHLYLRHNRSLGINSKQVIIIGAGDLGKRACDALLKQTWAGLLPVAFFDDDQHIHGQTHKGVKVEGYIDDVALYIESHRSGQGEHGDSIDQVWIALPLSSIKRIEELQHLLLDTATNVYLVPDLFGFNLHSYSVDEVAGIPVMNMSATPINGSSRLVKRLGDLLAAFIGLVLLSPLLLIVSVLIKLESPGPVFFKQRRYGLDGKEFLIWKFRSMTVTEDGDRVTQAQREDTRITNIGMWIRKLSIDELPQLINVVNGTMSLVGPRPHAVVHNEFYRKKVHGYMSRHIMKPGITGWAQVNGARGETKKIEDMEERIRYDLEYIRNWSIFLDIRIILMTFKTVINTENTY